jgi:predicted exporter
MGATMTDIKYMGYQEQLILILAHVIIFRSWKVVLKGPGEDMDNEE